MNIPREVKASQVRSSSPPPVRRPVEQVKYDSDSVVLGGRTPAELAHDALADLAKEGQSMAQIQEHVSQKHSPAKILKAGVMGGLGGVIAGGTWGALGTALVAGGGLLIAPALVVGGLLASTGIGISALPSLLAAGAATAIPSNAGLLSQIPTIAAAGAGICGALAAGLFMRFRLKQKELDQTALAQLQAKSSSS